MNLTTYFMVKIKRHLFIWKGEFKTFFFQVKHVYKTGFIIAVCNLNSIVRYSVPNKGRPSQNSHSLIGRNKLTAKLIGKTVYIFSSQAFFIVCHRAVKYWNERYRNRTRDFKTHAQ